MTAVLSMDLTLSYHEGDPSHPLSYPASAVAEWFSLNGAPLARRLRAKGLAALFALGYLYPRADVVVHFFFAR